MRVIRALPLLATVVLLTARAPAQDKDHPKEVTNSIGVKLVWIPRKSRAKGDRAF